MNRNSEEYRPGCYRKAPDIRGNPTSYEKLFIEKLERVKTLLNGGYIISAASVNAGGVHIAFKGPLDDPEKIEFKKISEDKDFNPAFAADILIKAGYFKEEISEINKLKKREYKLADAIIENKISLVFVKDDSRKAIPLGVNSGKRLNDILASKVLINTGYLTKEQSAEKFGIKLNGNEKSGFNR